MTYKNLKEFYLSKEEVEQALAVYNSDKSSEEQLFYIPYFEEFNNRRIYVPCEREYFYFWRNERRKERLQKIREGRCKVPSEKYGVKRCTADCKHCPYKQDPNDPDKEVTDYNWTGNALSLDEPIGFHDNGDPIYIDIADDSATVIDSLIEEEIKAERKKTVEDLLNELSELDRTIVVLYYSHSKSDADISKAVNVPRATVQRRRIKAFEYMKKRISEKF